MNKGRAFCASLIVFSAAAKSTVAQGCASCYTTAAAGGPQTAHALQSGILVLLVPPVLIFGGILVLLRRWRVQAFREKSDQAACLNNGPDLGFEKDHRNRQAIVPYAAWPQADIASNSDE